jgi:hypothetical protein
MFHLLGAKWLQETSAIVQFTQASANRFPFSAKSKATRLNLGFNKATFQPTIDSTPY